VAELRLELEPLRKCAKTVEHPLYQLVREIREALTKVWCAT
jgi:hypothetical protein